MWDSAKIPISYQNQKITLSLMVYLFNSNWQIKYIFFYKTQYQTGLNIYALTIIVIFNQ